MIKYKTINMNAIGIRCNPHKIFYSIIELNGDSFSVINQELIIPKSFDIPNKLKYVRKTFLDIFTEYNVETAGIRITEHNAQSPDLFRIMLEAVIQEVIASSSISYYFTGVISSICSKLNIPNDGQIKTMIEGTTLFLDMNEWLYFSKEHRESIFAGLASTNK